MFKPKRKTKKKAKTKARKKAKGLLKEGAALAMHEGGQDPADILLDREPEHTGADTKAARDAIKKSLAKQGSGNSWRPAVIGDSIYGIVTASRMSTKGKFGKQLVLTISIEEGVKDVFCNSVCLSQLHAEKVRVGDTVAISYKGKDKGQRGREYRVYTVFNASSNVRRKKGPIVTDDMLPESA